MSDIDALFEEQVGGEPERGGQEGHVERKERNIHAPHPDAVHDGRPGGRGDGDDLVAGGLKVAGQIVGLHLDPPEAGHVAVRDDPDPQGPIGGGKG